MVQSCYGREWRGFSFQDKKIPSFFLVQAGNYFNLTRSAFQEMLTNSREVVLKIWSVCFFTICTTYDVLRPLLAGKKKSTLLDTDDDDDYLLF